MSDNVLSLTSIKVNGSASTKEEAIAEANDLLLAAGAVTDEYLASMLERENSVSTYMGNYLAIPHGTNEGKDAILASALSFVRYSKPIDWNGEEVRFVVGIAGKEGGHLDILSKIAVIFSDEDEVEKLLHAPSDEALFALLSDVNED
ncbi:MAG: mannitol transporter subunit [Subtercola sp.]|jgi:PTS system mannitol-specific IIA component|nr:mannitol transporter subunit [Subtercola sp.]